MSAHCRCASRSLEALLAIPSSHRGLPPAGAPGRFALVSPACANGQYNSELAPCACRRAAYEQDEGCADGLDAAEILEIVDHHRLGGLVTAQPLLFNARPVGSTAAIVAREFEIEGVELPQSIASLLLGAMLTDTVIMKSPTTTGFDRDIIARTAEAVGVDPVEYGMSIFKCRSNPAELPVDKLVNADAKEFELSNGNKVYIGQYETVDLKAVLDREPEIREAIKALVAEKGYQFVLFFATDILAEGSQFICEGDTDFVNRAFNIDVTGKSVWMPGVLSRKKQVAAPILAL